VFVITGNLDKKKWGILVAITLPLIILLYMFLPQSHNSWAPFSLMVLFWVAYYTWVGLEKRKNKLAKKN